MGAQYFKDSEGGFSRAYGQMGPFFLCLLLVSRARAFKDSEGGFSRAYGQMGPFFLCLLLVSRARAFKDSEGGFSRAYGQMGPFLGARTNSLGLGQREGETKGLE